MLGLGHQPNMTILIVIYTTQETICAGFELQCTEQCTLHIFSLNYFFPVLFLQLLHFQKLSSILKLGVSSIIIVQIVHQCIMSKPPTPRYVQAKN